LLVVSFLSFPTKLRAEYLGSREDEKVAATVFGVALLAVTSLLSVLWRQARRDELMHPGTGDAEITLLSKRLRPSLALYVGLIVLGWYLPLVAVIGYLVVAFFLIVPIKLGRRRMASTGHCLGASVTLSGASAP
jgi:ABC-type Fe3+ transport system permease subunit